MFRNITRPDEVREEAIILQKNNISDQIQSIPIYKYLEDYISVIPRVRFEKGTYLFRGEDEDKTIFYILEGSVAIENITYNGKKLVTGGVEKHTFTGPIADVHNINLQSSGVALTAVEALVLSEELMNELMKNEEFAIYFYREINDRVFRLYKRLLAKVLFAPNEIVVHYILEHSENGIFTYKSAYTLCDRIGISRRGFYDIIHRLEKMGCIRKIESSVYEITNQRGLEQQAEHILGFMKD